MLGRAESLFPEQHFPKERALEQGQPAASLEFQCTTGQSYCETPRQNESSSLVKAKWDLLALTMPQPSLQSRRKGESNVEYRSCTP